MMKNRSLHLRSVLQKGFNLLFCLILLAGLTLPALAETGAEDSEITLYSNDILGNDMGEAGEPILAPASVQENQDLRDWCVSIHVDMYEDDRKLNAEDAVSRRGADVKLVINFALSNRLIKECDESTKFTYSITPKMQLSNISSTPFMTGILASTCLTGG